MAKIDQSYFDAPFDPSDNCPHCGSIQWEDRWGDLVKCVKCGTRSRPLQFIRHAEPPQQDLEAHEDHIR